MFLNLNSKPEWFVTKLGGRVPLIEQDEDNWISESLIEADYLDETHSDFNRLYPTDLFQKAKDRQVIDAYTKVSIIPTLKAAVNVVILR